MATLADLRAQVLDLTDHTGGSFHVANRVRDHINHGLSALHDLLINTFEDYSRKTQTIALVAGTETYGLPADYYKTTKVFYLTDNRRYTVPRFSLEQLSGYKIGPLNTGTIEHWYAVQFVPLVNETDVVPTIMVPGWEDFVVLHAATRLAMREKVDPGPYAAERDAKADAIMALAQPRDQNTVSISDVSGRWDPRLYEYIRDQAFMYRVMGGYIHFIEAEWLGL